MARFQKGETPKLTVKLIEEIGLLIVRGCYMETAAAACGISKDTLYRWLRNGKREDGSSLEKILSYAVMKSLAEAEVRDLEIIDKAAQGTADQLAVDGNGNILLDSNGNAIVEEYGLKPNWKASAWRLERKFPERWSTKAKPEVQEIQSLEITFVESPYSST